MKPTCTKRLPRGFRRCECSCGGFLGVFAADDDHGGVAALCPKCRKSIFIHNQVLMFPREQKVYYKNGTAVFSPQQSNKKYEHKVCRDVTKSLTKIMKSDKIRNKRIS